MITFRKSLAAALVTALALALPSIASAAPPTVAEPTATIAGAIATAGAIAQVSEATFAQEVLGFDGVVIVELYADWCGPCKMYSPIVHAVAESYKDNPRVKFLKLDGDGSPKLVQKLGGTAFPTTFFFMKDAGGAWRFGTQTAVLEEARLKAIVDKLLASSLPLPMKYE